MRKKKLLISMSVRSFLLSVRKIPVAVSQSKLISAETQGLFSAPKRERDRDSQLIYIFTNRELFTISYQKYFQEMK